MNPILTAVFATLIAALFMVGMLTIILISELDQCNLERATLENNMGVLLAAPPTHPRITMDD
jgi:hypothetical protein